MSRFTKAFKDAAIQKMMPPNPKSVDQLSQEANIGKSTLYRWKAEYRNKGISVPSVNKKAEKWSAEDKLAVVTETMSLNAHDMSEYCRKKGLYPEQIDQWKESALQGYKQSQELSQAKKDNRKKDQARINELEAELTRKEKALAEAAALLVLSKKCQAIWGENREC